MDRHGLYELCVQGPGVMAGFLRRVHGGRAGEALVLREDFCGTAAVARAWVEEGVRAGEGRTAVGVDLDGEVLERARGAAERAGVAGRVGLVRGDVLGMPVVEGDGCDVVFVGNFSIGYVHRRVELVRYLGACRRRLDMRGERGVMVCDSFDGAGAMREGAVTRVRVTDAGETVRYTWEQREADALTRMVTCAIHFQVERGGDVVERMRDAFVYRWRVWGIAELREAMQEAGFAAKEVYQEVGEGAVAMGHGREMGESGIVCVVGRVGASRARG